MADEKSNYQVQEEAALQSVSNYRKRVIELLDREGASYTFLGDELLIEEHPDPEKAEKIKKALETLIQEPATAKGWTK